MAKTAERKLEVARRIHEIVTTSLVCPRAAGLRRAHLHAGHRRRRVAPLSDRDDRGHPAVKARAARRHTSLGVCNVSFGLGQPARAVLNAVFLYHCVQAGLDLAIVNPADVIPFAELPADERDWPTTSFRPPRRRAERSSRSSRAGRRPRREVDGADAAWSPSSAPLPHPASQKGRRRGLDRPLRREVGARSKSQQRAASGDERGRRQIRRRRIDPAVRAPERRGHEEGRRPARELPRAEGRHEGPGRARHGLRRRPRHRQDPGQHDSDEQRLHGARPRQASAGRTIIDKARRSTRPRSASLRCSSRPASRCRSASGAAPAGTRVPGHDRWRGHQPRLMPIAALRRRRTTLLRAGVFYSKDAFEGLAPWTRWWTRPRGAPRWSRRFATRRETLREKPVVVDDSPPTTDDSVRSARAHRRTRSPSRRSGACARSTVDLDEVFPYLDRHVLFKLHWGGRGDEGRGVAPDRRGPRRRRGLRAAARAHVERAGLPAPAGRARLLPVQRRRQRARHLRPRRPRDASSSGSSSRASPSTTAICLADFYRPRTPSLLRASEHRRRRQLPGRHAPGVDGRLGADGDRSSSATASSPSSSSCTASACRPPRAWPSGMHARDPRPSLGDRRPTRAGATRWGYPACPDQSEHTKVCEPARRSSRSA